MKSNYITGRVLLGILYITIVSAIVLAATFVSKSKKSAEAEVTLSNIKLSVIIADTPALQERGLSGHPALAEKEGMLFVFPLPVRTGFWMKDMLFPIDIIWFDASRQIVDVWENALPESYPEIRAPQSDAMYVLEVQSGYYKKHNLKMGDVVELAGIAGYNR